MLERLFKRKAKPKNKARNVDYEWFKARIREIGDEKVRLMLRSPHIGYKEKEVSGDIALDMTELFFSSSENSSPNKYDFKVTYEERPVGSKTRQIFELRARDREKFLKSATIEYYLR